MNAVTHAFSSILFLSVFACLQADITLIRTLNASSLW